jgi:hypothetical protein
VIALLCTGCSKLLGIGSFGFADGGGGITGDVATTGDGGHTGPTADARQCFGSLAQLCLTSPPSGNVVIAAAIDTSSDPRCATVAQPTGPELCVISGGAVQVTGTVATSGARPLVVVAGSTLTISGTLDASSTVAGAVGAGADPAECSAPTPPAAGTGGGGPGGSFGAVGGAGGDSQFGGSSLPAAAQPLSYVRGGCAGSDGTVDARFGLGGAGGVAGRGGGAIYLVAGTQIGISGSVFASGAGGSTGGGYSGGGGGGTGGMIAIEAPTVDLSGATIAANGGGGAGGDSALGPAGPGADGTTTTPNAAASGGSATAASSVSPQAAPGTRAPSAAVAVVAPSARSGSVAP